MSLFSFNKHRDEIPKNKQIQDIELSKITPNKFQPRRQFSEESIKDINTMYEKVMKTYEMSLQSMREGSSELALKVVKMEEQVDIIERSCRSAHIYRLNNSMCNPEAGIIFLDLLSNLERISDHASNIAKAVIDAKGSISA